MVRGMLLWLNGPFGGGKTQTAHEVRRRLPGSVVCDPEHLGIGLHRMMPRALRGNYQDIPAWRQSTRQVLGGPSEPAACSQLPPEFTGTPRQPAPARA